MDLYVISQTLVELEKYPTVTVRISRGDSIQSFSLHKDIFHYFKYLKKYYKNLEDAMKMQAQYTGQFDTNNGIYRSIKATEDMNFVMHDLVPPDVKQYFNLPSQYIAVYPKLVNSKTMGRVAGFVITNGFTIQQARETMNTLRSINAQMVMQCKYCGGITNGIDIEYLSGADHLECVLKDEIAIMNGTTC